MGGFCLTYETLYGTFNGSQDTDGNSFDNIFANLNFVSNDLFDRNWNLQNALK